MQKDTLRDFGRYGAIGIEFAASVLIGVAIGYIIDKKIEITKPWGTLIFTVLGFLAGFKRLTAISKGFTKKGCGDKKN